jgi:hypothetical protein
LKEGKVLGEDNFSYNNYNYNKEHNVLDKHVRMASTALIMGLIAIPLCFFMYTGIVIGGLAILFAILSKGTADKLLPQAKKAIAYGSIGIVLGYSVITYNFYSVMTNEARREELNIMSEKFYGESFDDMLKETMESLGF